LDCGVLTPLSFAQEGKWRKAPIPKKAIASQKFDEMRRTALNELSTWKA
jgi:hypothetical protein